MSIDLDPEVVRERNHRVMRALLDYEPEKPHWLTRLLWRCAGADARLLSLCTHGEHVTYAGLGAFVLITGMLATLTGGYALYTVFKPTDGSSEVVAIAIAIVFGLFWGTMIFNLDRYIVASSGKGDGKESISLQELKNAAPRIILAVVIGMVMSAPLELRLFKREIDVALAERRASKRSALEARDSSQFAAQSLRIDSTIGAYEAEITRAHDEAQRAYAEMRDEGDGIAGTGRAGAGPRFAAKRARYEALRISEDQVTADRRRRQDSLRSIRTAAERDMDAKRAQSQLVAAEMGGIVDQMEIAHEKGGMIVWIIRMLIILLEVIPVLSKLMYRTGPYDILQEQLRVMIPAKLGITTETRDLLVDGELITRTTELFPMAETVQAAASAQLERMAANGAATASSVASALTSPTPPATA